MNREEIISEVAEEITRLTEFHRRMVAGDELCDHHYNHSDRCFETYCTGCECHIGERHCISNVPFKSDAYCYTCYTKMQGGAE